MSREDEIRKASAQFYVALNRMLNGDAQPLSDIWSHGPTVTTMKVAGQIRVTNIYQREAGAWKMTHHHTDLAPAMVEVLDRLQSRSEKAST
jgi:hypothetical protein